MKNRIRAWTVAALLGQCLIGSTAWAADSVKVRTDFLAWGLHAGLHLAQQKGWFKEAGLDVVIEDGAGSANTIQLVAAGQVDIGQVQLGTMALARENNLPVKAVAGWFRKADLAVLVDKDSPISSPKDLAGKTLVVFSTSPWAPYIDSYLKKGGLDRSKVKLMNVSPNIFVSSYNNHQADAILTPAPYGLPIVQLTRPSKALLAADVGISFPSYGLIASESTIANRADVLRRFVKVQQRAWAYIYDGHVDEGVDAILKQRPNAVLNRIILAGQLSGYKDFLNTPATVGKPLGWQAESDWKAAIADMEASSALKPGRQPAEFYTNDFID